MIRFDAKSIEQRLLKRMQQDPNWKAISNNSVISSLLRSTSEINSETARYAEYLFKESKWDTAQNPNSILAMANMLGYQPLRKISARGNLKISLDPRIHLIGKSLPASLLDESNEKENNIAKLNSMGWKRPYDKISITPQSTIVDSKNKIYIPLSQTFPQDAYFTNLNIIQGIRKSTFIDLDSIRNVSTVSKLDPYLYIPITIKNCEAASNPTSKAYFRIYLCYPAAGEASGKIIREELRIVNTLLFSTASDKDVEVYNDLYSQNLFYLKFNNDPNRGRILDISPNSSLLGIQIDYIESLGAQSNLMDLFENFVITNVSVKNANGTTSIEKLYGINYEAITGGKDEESILEIKERAPKFYIKNYTAGTKEAYENTILNLEFSLGGKLRSPKKVQVYGGFMDKKDSNGNIVASQPVTYVSFIIDSLEDMVQSDLENPYKDIEESLNYYLARLKSPQDTLKFIPPNYVPFALGLNCRIKKGTTVDVAQLEGNIRDLVEAQWGPSSDYLNFNRNFFPSQITSLVQENFSEVESISAEIEAIDKVNWSMALRKNPNKTFTQSGNRTYTIRVPYSFNPVFLGKKAIKGFKDRKVGSDYVLRFDVMYKRPKAMKTSQDYHVSIFIQDNPERQKDAFCHIKTRQENLWVDSYLSTDTEYSDIFPERTDRLDTSYQFYFRNEIYSDNNYRELINDSKQGLIQPITDHTINEGALDDYMVYFSANYDLIDSSENIGEGWIELSFDSIYSLLSKFSLYDVNLKEALSKCPLALLKCGESAQDTFEKFKSILRDYVDIYVSLKPYDTDLNLDEIAADQGSTVLYIDSFDSQIANKSSAQTELINLTSQKKPRMISVLCN